MKINNEGFAFTWLEVKLPFHFSYVLFVQSHHDECVIYSKYFVDSNLHQIFKVYISILIMF